MDFFAAAIKHGFVLLDSQPFIASPLPTLERDFHTSNNKNATLFKKQKIREKTDHKTRGSKPISIIDVIIRRQDLVEKPMEAKF